jgi:hypothetical protein
MDLFIEWLESDVELPELDNWTVANRLINKIPDCELVGRAPVQTHVVEVEAVQKVAVSSKAPKKIRTLPKSWLVEKSLIAPAPAPAPAPTKPLAPPKKKLLPKAKICLVSC